MCLCASYDNPKELVQKHCCTTHILCRENQAAAATNMKSTCHLGLIRQVYHNAHTHTNIRTHENISCTSLPWVHIACLTKNAIELLDKHTQRTLPHTHTDFTDDKKTRVNVLLERTKSDLLYQLGLSRTCVCVCDWKFTKKKGNPFHPQLTSINFQFVAVVSVWRRWCSFCMNKYL
jgi:hypothetical protein